VPVVGGHTNTRTDRSQLAVAILGRAKSLLTSFDARPGHRLVAAIDLRGRYREPLANWEAATDAPPARLRADLELLPTLAESKLATAAKDISQGGLVGTTMMLAECSRVGAQIDLTRLPRPDGVSLEQWLVTFPSYGFVLAVCPENVARVVATFGERSIAAADIGEFTDDHRVVIGNSEFAQTIWDFSHEPLMGYAAVETVA